MLRYQITPEEVVVGCSDCGEVQLLVDGQLHVCGHATTPMAVTIDGAKIPFPALST